MADTERERVLSQHEVDALLSAIDSGDVEISAETGAAVLSVPYDFRRPERVGREQVRAIEALHEIYARSLRAELSGVLRTMVEVKVTSVIQLTFTEFINSLPNPTVFTVLSCKPMEGSFILEMNPAIAFPIIERLLGSGKLGTTQPERALTPIEWKLMDTVFDRALDLLKDAWSSVVPATFKVTERESNPNLMHIFSTDEAVVAVVIEIGIGDRHGYLNLCLPLLSIEEHLDKIASHALISSKSKPDAPGQEQTISRQLGPAELQLSVHLPIESMRVRELQDMKPGDLILSHHPEAAAVLVSVEGRPKFVARLGSLGDRKAIKIISGLDPLRESTVLKPRAAMDVRRSGAKGRAEASGPEGAVDGVLDVPLGVSVALAEKTMRVRDVLALKTGEVIEFDTRLDEALVLRVGDRLIATGSVVKIGDKYGLQVSSIGDPRETASALGPGAL